MEEIEFNKLNKYTKFSRYLIMDYDKYNKKIQGAINISFPISNTNLETGVGFLYHKKKSSLMYG